MIIPVSTTIDFILDPFIVPRRPQSVESDVKEASKVG